VSQELVPRGGDVDRREAHVRARLRPPGAALARPGRERTRVQRRPPLVRVTRLPVLVDLPVDTTVVLEQQEGAQHLSGGERALRER
jgi:hypothetical protein